MIEDFIDDLFCCGYGDEIKNCCTFCNICRECCENGNEISEESTHSKPQLPSLELPETQNYHLSQNPVNMIITRDPETGIERKSYAI